MLYNSKMLIGQKLKAFISNPKWTKKVSYSLVILCAVLSTVFAVFLYKFTENLLSERLYERLKAIVATASLNITPEEISYLLKIGPEESLKTEEYRIVIMKLMAIKRANPDITFIYIYKKTDDPSLVTFVADADVIALQPNLNFNEDEVTDEGFPGSEYDVSEIDLITTGEAFETPVVDPVFYETMWGTLMTAYSPLPSIDGTNDALLGIDVEISNYRRLVMATFIPFGVFIIFLLSLLATLTVILVRLWGAQVELLKDLDRQKDELLGIVSHQLATPISALKWDFEMLLDGDFGEFNAEQKSFFGKLQEVARHLADLASMILDVSRIQLGRMKVDRTDLDMKAFFGEILTVMEAKAQEHKAKLSASIPADIGTASLDKRLMHMIVENLMSNAIKYTPEGGKVKLDVSLAGKELKISVSDTGCGIPKQDQDKIFGKLFRASNVRSVDGNGFGLFVVKGATEAQGGTISFESQEGEGTIFTVILPL